MSVDHRRICGVTGPDVRCSAQFIRPAQCNRVSGHEELGEGEDVHREVDEHFRVIAEWKTPRDVAPKKRKSQAAASPLRGRGRHPRSGRGGNVRENDEPA